jgi:hypothetical protein
MTPERHEAFIKSKGKTLFTPDSSLEGDNLRVEKIRSLKLLLSFAIAVKHHLRAEYGTEFPDFVGVLPSNFGKYNALGYSNADSPAPEISRDATLIDPVTSPASGSQKRLHGSQASEPDAKTPLLQDDHHTIDFRPYTPRKASPLPLVYVLIFSNLAACSLIIRFRIAIVLPTSSPVAF